MDGTFLDFLPADALPFVGAIALLMAVAGLIVWGAGIKIARFSVAMILGLGLAVLAAILVPRWVTVTPVSCALAGFAVGAVAGALAFRLLQGVVLAVCLSLAVAGVYYRWHVVPVVVVASQPQAVAASETLIPTAALATTNSDVQYALSMVQNWSDRWSAIPPADQKHIEFLYVGTAVIVLLIAFGFPRATTLAVSAIVGTVMMLAGGQALVHLYAPGFEEHLALPHRWAYLVLAMVALGGMSIQYRLFWPRKAAPAPPHPAAPGAPAA